MLISTTTGGFDVFETFNATVIDVGYKSPWIFEKEDSEDVLDLL